MGNVGKEDEEEEEEWKEGQEGDRIAARGEFKVGKWMEQKGGKIERDATVLGSEIEQAGHGL